MMHRLHFEEAQQSSYAITPARAGSEVKDERESESLAAEFQSLLAQISGQIGTIPDQLTAVSFALAQSGALERPKQTEERAAEPQQVGAQDNGSPQLEDSGGNLGGPVYNTVDDRQGSRREQRSISQQRSDVATEEQVEGVEVTAAQTQVATEEVAPVVQEVVAEGVDHETELVSQVVTTEDQSSFQQIAAQVNRSTEEAEDASVVVAHDQEGLSVDGEATNGGIATAVKREGQKESSDETETEDPLAQSVSAGAERADFEGNLRKNAHSGSQKTRTEDQAPHDSGHHPTDAQAHSNEQYTGGRHSGERQFTRPEDSLSAQLQRASDTGKKAGGKGLESHEFSTPETTLPVETNFEQRRSENTLQLILLRQAFEGVRAARNDMSDQARLKPSAQPVQGLSAAADTKASQSENSARAKPLTRPQVMRMLERVESTLKEAARGRDGKTISLHLEPVDLGKVKVDVSLREGTLHARISPENQQVMHALREHAHELQGALRKLGLEVDSVTVSVTAEEFSGEMATGQEASDGRSFQQERNNMPHERAQVTDNTIGNELALRSKATVESGRAGAGNVADHWIA